MIEEPQDMLDALDKEEGDARFIFMGILADYLEDHGSYLLADGWRWVAKERKEPQFTAYYYLENDKKWYWFPSTDGIKCSCDFSILAHIPVCIMYVDSVIRNPAFGGSILSSGNDVVCFNTRIEAEIAVVRAYAAYVNEIKNISV